MKFGDLSEEAQAALRKKVVSGTVFVDQEVTGALALAATSYLYQYTGNNPFLNGVKEDLLHKGLTTSQVCGTLNMMVDGIRSALSRREAQQLALAQQNTQERGE